MRLRIHLLIFLALTLFAPAVRADDFSSTNFTVKDSVLESGSYGSSSNYNLWGVIPEIAPTVGESTNFGLNPGFLAFTGATMPTLSATADTDSFSLSWTATTGSVAVTYEPGFATTPGGPYTFSGTQTMLSATITGLTPSTAYYLIVRVKEQGGGQALLGYSNELAISTLTEDDSEDSDPSQGQGSGQIIPPAGWIYSPSGLVPVGISGDEELGNVLRPGQSLTITPSLLRQFGIVVTVVGGVEVPVPDAEIRLRRLNQEAGQFADWPNRQSALTYTDGFGVFSFLVPDGIYLMDVSASGYLKHMSKLMVVDSTGQFEQRIELVKGLEIGWPWIWLTMLGLTGALLLGFIFWIISRTRRGLV